MVCMLGRWRMAAVVKLLKVDNYSDVTTEDINDEKIAAQILRKGFLDADEANLLEEEDMHVFGCKPMADPLHLVCCNSCKKPVRASQYTAHAERCTPLTSKRDSSIGSNNEVGAMKPPLRKGRKASEITTSANQNSSIIGTKVKKETSDKIHVPVLVTGVENQNLSSVVGRDVPRPLATKIYRCQRNSQLRFELSQIYHEACEEGCFGNCSNIASMQENGVVNSHAMSCVDPLYASDKNSFVQTKQSKSFQKEARQGIPNGRYHTIDPNWENSVNQINGGCP